MSFAHLSTADFYAMMLSSASWVACLFFTAGCVGAFLLNALDFQN